MTMQRLRQPEIERIKELMAQPETKAALALGLFENSVIGCALTLEDGTFCSVNDRYCEVTRWPREELVWTRTRHDITIPEDLQLDAIRNERALAGGHGTQKGITKLKGCRHGDAGVEVWTSATLIEIPGVIRCLLHQAEPYLVERDISDRLVAILWQWAKNHAKTASLLTLFAVGGPLGSIGGSIYNHIRLEERIGHEKEMRLADHDRYEREIENLNKRVEKAETRNEEFLQGKFPWILPPLKRE